MTFCKFLPMDFLFPSFTLRINLLLRVIVLIISSLKTFVKRKDKNKLKIIVLNKIFSTLF